MAQSIFDSTQLPVLKPHTHCVLMARDPNNIYAYWDYTQEDIKRLRHQLGRNNQGSGLILRVYNKTANHSWDLELGFSVKNRYVQVAQDNADYGVELGINARDGQFISLTRSNIVRTPPQNASPRNDLILQDIKAHQESRPYIKEDVKEDIKERYQQLMQQKPKKKHHVAVKKRPARVYQLSVGDIRDYYKKLFIKVSSRGRSKAQQGIQVNSIGNILKGKWSLIPWQKVCAPIVRPGLMKRSYLGASLMGQIDAHGSSENLISIHSGASEGLLKKRSFLFEVWTEVIVHGRTEPDASVYLNDKGIKLNPDGTFSLRYALPDGEIPLKFLAQSSDGIEQRFINTGVEREKTSYATKIIKE